MSAGRSRQLTGNVVAVVCLAILAVAAALLGPRPAEDLPSGSSFSKGPSGSAAAYLTLQAIGHPVRRSYDALPSIAAVPASTVLVVADPGEAASNQDRRALYAFVAAGGTALVTGCNGATFLSSTAVGVVVPDPEPRTSTARVPSPLSAGVPSIRMAAACVEPQLGPEYLPLYADGEREVVLFARVGQGLAIWWAGDTPIENGAIEEAGHLELLLNAAGSRDRTIVWDEFYHGQRRSLWSYASRTPLPWGLPQAALVALVAAAMFARRRAPVRERVVVPRTSPLEFVETMAALYARAPSAAAAVALARLRLRRLLLAATGLSPDTSDARLAAAAPPRLPVGATELRGLLEAADRAGSNPLTTADSALPLVRTIQTVAATLHGD